MDGERLSMSIPVPKRWIRVSLSRWEVRQDPGMGRLESDAAEKLPHLYIVPTQPQSPACMIFPFPPITTLSSPPFPSTPYLSPFIIN